MQSAIDQFQENIQRSRELGEMYQILNAQTTNALDLSDSLRFQWVMAVSSLDHYVHELVRLGMLEAYQGIRPQTEAFSRFQVSLGSVIQAANLLGNLEWLEDQIKNSPQSLEFSEPGQHRRRRQANIRSASVE